MTNELKPCPFQKEGEVHELELVDVGALKWVRCKTCNAQGPCDPSEQKAMDLWNTRYKRTCEIGDGLDCSNCGAIFDIGPCDKPRFCMYCGAEVADAD